MHDFWEPIIEPLLERLRPKIVVEVAMAPGPNTRNLLDYSGLSGAVVHTIDEGNVLDADQWLSMYPDSLVVHRAPAAEVLASIAAGDLVLLDGEANWHTVTSCLRAIEAAPGLEGKGYPVVLVHNVGWPYGRRDRYGEPNRVPEPNRRPSARGGVRPGWRQVDPDGGLNRDSRHAQSDGGARNGVLTAVEDFLNASVFDLEVVSLPALNGIAVIYPADLLEANPKAGEFLKGLDDRGVVRDTLEVVEDARSQTEVAVADGQRDAVVQAEVLQAEIDRLEGAHAERIEYLHKAHLDQVQRLEESIQKSENLNEARLSEIDELRTNLAESEATNAKLLAERAALGESADRLRDEVIAHVSQYEALRNRRSVHLALAFAKIFAPAFRLARRGRHGTADDSDEVGERVSEADDGQPPLRPADAKSLIREIRKRRPGSNRSEGPMVSIIVLTRNGADRMRTLLSLLDATRYRSFEVVVVDNGSGDATGSILKEARSFPLRVVRNYGNTSFSSGNRQGVRVASGEFLLFLNNDVEPLSPGWLGALVDALESRDDIVAAGAVLAYPLRHKPTDLQVQHRGIRFGFRNEAVRAYNIGARDPLGDEFAGIVDVPAATAAALLVKKSAYVESGGFDDNYVYGTEDVDLCLRLKDLGRIVVTGQAILFHNESATQTEVGSQITRINRIGNWQQFSEVWGPLATRSVRRDQLTGSGRWTHDTQPTVAITLTSDDPSAGWGDYYTAHELGDAFANDGWQVVYAEREKERWYELEGDIDLVISLLEFYDVRKAPAGALTIAWVRNWVDRWIEQTWFEDFDLVAASSQKAADLISKSTRYHAETFPLACNPDRFSPGPTNPTFDSDYIFSGNNWGQGRALVDCLDVRPGERFLVFGKGWEDDPFLKRYWRGSLDYDLLPDAYRSTTIVLDDSSTHTLPYASINSRVFDALAAGTLVLTNNAEGSVELFDGLLPSYSNREELRGLLDRYLSNSPERDSLVAALRETVLRGHSYPVRQAGFVDFALRHVDQPQAAIKIGVPRPELKPAWGDTHFANALASSLTALGMPTVVHILPEWDSPENQTVDVVIHLRGLSRYVPKQAHLNVMWLISHPEDVTLAELEAYDLVLVASRKYADWLSGQIDTPVEFMPQASDQRRFHPVDPDSLLASEVLFVGNSRGQRRPAVEWALSNGLPLTVYGEGWSGLARGGVLRATHFPNENLATLYGSAKVVLNDHWPDMRDSGFVSNRVFDALASGSVVVSDPVDGLRDLFGDLVPTYATPDDLANTVRELLEDDDKRKQIGALGSALVNAEHTFANRAERMLELLRPMLSGRRKDLEGNKF
jgi:GT2 family glycosyltransferase